MREAAASTAASTKDAAASAAASGREVEDGGAAGPTTLSVPASHRIDNPSAASLFEALRGCDGLHLLCHGDAPLQGEKVPLLCVPEGSRRSPGGLEALSIGAVRARGASNPAGGRRAVEGGGG
eukprot:5583958-Prymnesium_polylepis.1